MKKIDRRERIVDAALEIFSRNGYKDTTIREIAKKAGVGLGTTFYYFKDKDDLFYSVIFREVEKEREKVLAKLDEIAKKEKNPYKLLKKRLFNSIETLEQNELLKKIFLKDPSLVIPFIHDKFHLQYLNRILSGLEILINDGIKQGYLKKVDTKMAAFSIISVLNSFLFSSVAEREKIDIGKLIKFSGNLIIDGMAKNPLHEDGD